MQRTASRPTTSRTGSKASPLFVWTALWAVYIVWGSTYLAIRVVVRTMPPFLSASVRFIISGALLYLIAVRRGDRAGDRPGARQWIAAAIVGGGGGGGGAGVPVFLLLVRVPPAAPLPPPPPPPPPPLPPPPPPPPPPG